MVGGSGSRLLVAADVVDVLTSCCTLLIWQSVHRYIVAFRSARRKDAPIEATESLYQADRDAHEEAVTAGGLLMYWCVGRPFQLVCCL